MKLENQVCTLEQAKRLKELGVAQKSLFAYADDNTICAPHYTDMPMSWCMYPAAFTVAELGVTLPPETKSFDSESFSAWVIMGIDGKLWFLSATEAECRADLLIQLLESGRITAAEVNARLTGA